MLAEVVVVELRVFVFVVSVFDTELVDEDVAWNAARDVGSIYLNPYTT